MSTCGLHSPANSQRIQTDTALPPSSVHAPAVSLRTSPKPPPGQQRWACLLEAATNTSIHHQHPGEREHHNDQQQYQATIDWLQVLRELYYYARQEGMCMHNQGAALPGGVKKPRLVSTSTTSTPPDRSQLCPASQQALDQLLAAMATLHLHETFWQTAWRSMRLCLGVHEDEAQAEGGGCFQPIAAISPAEQQALKQIMEPHRQAEMARIQQQLARLEDLGPTATAAAAAHGPVSTPTNSTDALTRDEQVVQQAQPAPAAPAPNTPELQHIEQQLQLMPAADPTPTSQTAATYQLTSAAMSSQAPPMQGWFNPPVAFRRPNLGRPVGSGNKRPLQQMQAGGAGPAAAGFSIRSVKYTGIYRSRRFEEGWRAQFAFANKVCWAFGGGGSGHRCGCRSGSRLEFIVACVTFLPDWEGSAQQPAGHAKYLPGAVPQTVRLSGCSKNGPLNISATPASGGCHSHGGHGSNMIHALDFKWQALLHSLPVSSSLSLSVRSLLQVERAVATLACCLISSQ